MLKKLALLAALLIAAACFAAVDVNQASEAELDGIKGIGPSLSRKILEARKKGPFQDWSDLRQRVKGIGNKNAAKLSESGLNVNGAGYQATPGKAQQPTRSQ
jgi:competence protein ComEA